MALTYRERTVGGSVGGREGNGYKKNNSGSPVCLVAIYKIQSTVLEAMGLKR